jgi:cytochrome c oxidase subunit III
LISKPPGPPPIQRTIPEIIDGSKLPRHASGPTSTNWWGVIFVEIIILTIFGALFSSYFYLMSGHLAWPPHGIAEPNLFLPTIKSLFLVAAALPMWWSVRSIRRGDQWQLKLALAVGFVLGTVFLVLTFIYYRGVNYNWATNAYGSIVWTIVGFFVLILIAGLLKTALVWLAAYRGFFDPLRYSAVETNALYWYFLAGMWIIAYFMLYWSPRWF